MARQKIRKIIRRLGPNKPEDKHDRRHTSDISTQVKDEEKSGDTSEIFTSNLDDDKSGDASNDDKPISQVDDYENDGKTADPLITDVDSINEIEETEVIDEREVIDVTSTAKGHSISEKIVKHYYIPKKSKFWWLKLLCCLVIIALLLWILYCLYKGCCNNNYVNQSSHSTTIAGRTITPSTDNDVVDRNTIRKGINTSQETSSIVDQPIVNGQTQSNKGIAGDVNRTQKGVTKSNDQNTMTLDLPVTGEPAKPNKEIKFETFNTPEEVNFDFVPIKGGTISYRGIDWKGHEETLEDYEVMSSEVTFREYSYFTNIHNEHLPEYRNKSKHDVNMNVNSPYRNTCFDKDCPVVGISVEDIIAYIEWLNNKTGDSYKILSEAQWHHRNTKPDLETEVWYENNSNGRAHGVREKDKNRRGIYGLYGNASELCITNEGYGIKGGSWDSPERALFKSSKVDVKTKSNSMGFRLVKVNKTNKDKK